jgi:hypothetical protein
MEGEKGKREKGKKEDLIHILTPFPFFPNFDAILCKCAIWMPE